VDKYDNSFSLAVKATLNSFSSQHLNFFTPNRH